MEHQGPASEEKPVARLGPDIKAKIGHQLGIMYSEILNQGVPDRFADILRGLDAAPRHGTPEQGKSERQKPERQTSEQQMSDPDLSDNGSKHEPS